MGGGGGGGGVRVGWALDIGAAATLHLTTNSTISPGVESTKHSGEKRIGILHQPAPRNRRPSGHGHSLPRRRCAVESCGCLASLAVCFRPPYE